MFPLRRCSETVSKHLLCNLSLVRSMGGGPRTFPGGLNKWQWKRMHEKKAKDKERKLLDQEKQLYQARVRSQIRANLSGGTIIENKFSSTSSDHNNPMSAKDQIKALADRFMKAGAEDLWNEDDGPITNSREEGGEPTRNVVMSDRDRGGRRNLGENRRGGDSMTAFGQFRPRYYSVQAGRRSPQQKFKFRRDDSSTSGDDDSDYGAEEKGSAKWPKRLSFNQGKSDKELDSKGRTSGKTPMPRAALGSYDAKKIRVRPKFAEEDEFGLSQQAQLIRDELRKRNVSRQDLGRQEEESLLSNKRFDECNISPLTIKALTSAGYLQMTRVQDATISACLDGMDALVKAKTGTGKSAAFLLPAIEAVLKATSSRRNQRVLPILALVLCPTRELACQIAAEATVILKYHDGIGVQTLIGGTRFKDDQKRLESDPCQIVVATPGRLLDHIENTSGFSVRLMGLQMLVLDEADHLLDLGFRKDIEKVIDCVPRQRQSLLLSATIPKEVRRISQLVLKRDHISIDTVGVGDVDTHAKVFLPLQLLIPSQPLNLKPENNQVLLPSSVMAEDQTGGDSSLLPPPTTYQTVRGGESHKRIDSIVVSLYRDSCNVSQSPPPIHTKLPLLKVPSSQVKQSYYIAPHELHFQIVHQLLKEHISQVVDYKVIVFCTTAMVTSLMFLLLHEMKMNVREMHSRKPQLYRTRISDEVKESKRLILVTSDVSARGMNYPDVTLVVQVGIPSDREQYIHRLGRTGREGKEGEGVLLLAPWEEYFLADIRDLPIERSPSMQLDPEIKLKVENAMMKIDTSVKEAAYHAWLGFYNSIREIGRDKTTLVELANRFCGSIGLQRPPALFRKTILKMGLKDIPGIRVRK